MKPVFRMKTLAMALAAGIMMTVTVAIAIAGNDFVQGELCVDLSEVYNARDYRVLLLANDKPSGGTDYTTAWLSLDLAQYNRQPFSAQFSQVGLLTKSDGVRWFVYAEPGVTCLRGSADWGTCNGRPCGCEGTPGDLVSLSTWHWVELVTYGR